MKNNTFYPFVAGIFTAFLFVWIWACTQPASAPAQQETKMAAPAQASTPAPPAILNDSLHWERAQADIDKWQKERDKIHKKLQKSDAFFVVKGFHVPVKDIVELFTALQGRQIDSVWAMQAIMKGPAEADSSTHLIFQALKKSASAKSVTTSPQYEYYDISSPCPTNCPPVNL